MSSSDTKNRPKPGPWPPAPESAAMPPSSWAKRTGFRPKFSGETNVSSSGQINTPVRTKEPDSQPDLEVGQVRPAPVANGEPEREKVQPPPADKDQAVKRRRDSDGGPKGANPAANGPTGPNGSSEPVRRTVRNDEVVDVLPQNVEDDGFVGRHSHMKYELRDTPGLGGFFLIFFPLLVYQRLLNCSENEKLKVFPFGLLTRNKPSVIFVRYELVRFAAVNKCFDSERCL